MSIQALPSAAVRLIGASQVITDASSLLKELIDNALDARATSITIDVSTDTLSTLQVRDNGHGVAPQDRDLLCKRYCTSKIREYAELKDIGGSSLGFRGEALASACEISGEMIVTTRVEGEEVASCLKMSPKGEIKSRSRASHPVGTTIKVTELFKSLPVRKQTAIKVAAKTLARVKSMLQAYALARPNVRFALKVLKAKNDKGNWTYVPAKGQPKEDAAFKVVGKECAGQCEWQVMEMHGFEVQAFLPRPDAVPSKVSNVGQFVSIDGRPVSTAQGTLKQIVTLFKERLRACGKSLEGVKDPFLWLNLVCPPGSYDANVEPAKDDVVFEESELVIEAVGALLSSYYVPEPVQEEHEEDLNATMPEAAPVVEEVDELGNRPTKRPRTAKSGKRNMYSGDDENVIMVNTGSRPITPVDDGENSQEAINDISVSNPWVMAKMNASVKPSRIGSLRNGQLLTPLHEHGEQEDNSLPVGQNVNIPPHPPWATFASSSSPLGLRPAVDDAEEAPLPFQHLPPRQYDDEEADEVEGAEDESSLFIPDDDTNHQPATSSRWRGWSKTADFTTAAQLPPGTQPPLISATPNAFQLLTPQTNARPQRKKQQNVQQDDYHLATPHAQDESRVWFDHLQPFASGSSPAARRNGNGATAKRQQAPGIDIRDMFASSAIVAPRQSIGEIQDEHFAEPPGHVLGSSRPRRSAPRVANGNRAGVNAPFQPVMPSWRRNMSIADAQEIREDSILDEHTPGLSDHLYNNDRDVTHDDMTAPLTNEPQRPLLPQDDTTSSIPFPSSIANLSTPRRLAACIDCHNPDSTSHTHSHNHDDTQPQQTYQPPTHTKSSGLSRTRTAALAKLPLERTPTGFQLQNVETTLRGFSYDAIAASARRMRQMEEAMPLEFGVPVWGVMEAIRAGEVEIFEDGEAAATQEVLTQQSNGQPRVNVEIQAQSAFTAPPVSEAEAQEWQRWVGEWIAKSYRIPSADEVTQEGDGRNNAFEAEVRAGVYVVDAVMGCAA